MQLDNKMTKISLLLFTAISAVAEASRSQRLGASLSEDVVDIDRHPLQIEPTQIENHERRVVEVRPKAEAQLKSEVQSKDSSHSKHPQVVSAVTMSLPWCGST